MQKRTEKFRQSMTKLGAGMMSVGRGMSVGVTAPVGLAGAAVLSTAVDFQKSINKVGAVTRTIMGGQVTPEFEALEKEALRLGSTTEFTSTQAADAMGLLGRAGFSAAEILSSVDDVLALASASGQDLAFTADVMAKTIRAFGLEASEATRVSDVLSDVARRTNVDLETISETFKDAAPIAKAYGMTLEQTAAITGLLGDVGIQGSKAGTTLKNIMLKIAAPSALATKMLKAMNITVEDGAGGMKDVGKILTELTGKLGTLPKKAQLQVINELFGLRGIAGAAALMEKAINEGRDPIAAMTEVLKGSTGAAKDMQQTMLRGAPGALARFQSALEGLMLAIAKSGLLEWFGDILDKLAGLFSRLSETNPMLLKIGTVFALVAAAVGPLVLFLGWLISLIPAIVTGFAAISAASLPITGTTLLIAAGIAAVVAAIGYLIYKFNDIKKWISENPFGQFLTQLFLLFTPIGHLILLIKFVINHFDTLKKIFMQMPMVQWIMAVVDAMGWLISKVKELAGPAMGFLNKLAGPIVGILNAVAPVAGEGGLLGAPKGANNAQAEIATTRTENTNNAKVSVDFNNVPRGTRVSTQGELDLGLNFGKMGLAL